MNMRTHIGSNPLQSVFGFFTRIAGYGIAVAFFSILWSGLITELNLLYLIPIISLFFDFSAQWFTALKILFVLPFPTALLLYGFFTRIGVPAIIPSFRIANRMITAENGRVDIQQGRAAEDYVALLRAINRIPVIFFIVAVTEVAYIDITVLVMALRAGYSGPSICLIFFSWFAQTMLYAGVGFVLAETVTGPARKKCKRMLREMSVRCELKSPSSVKFKMFIVTALVASIITYSILMTHLRRDSFMQVLAYLAIFGSVLGYLVYLIVRSFFSALYDVDRAVDSLKDRGHGIIYSASLDREITLLEAGINSASDTITDYRINLEKKVDERTKQLSDAKSEIEAAMQELEAMNENLVAAVEELEESNSRYRRDMKMAGSVQSAFLPKEPPQSGEYDLAFVFRPASEVSGDFYDFYHDNGVLAGAGIFDVSGHGISSGLLTLLVRSIIAKTFSTRRGQKLGPVMDSVNKSLIEELGQSGYYITGILLRFGNGHVEYVNSGHPHLIYRSARTGAAGIVVPADSKDIIGPFLGMEALDRSHRSITIKFNPGDCLLLYTDSFIESTDHDNRQFDEKRLTRALKEAPDSSAAEMLDFILGRFYSFIDRDMLKDDISAVLIKKKT